MRIAIGIDIAKEPIAWGLRKYGLDLRLGGFEDADFDEQSFDLILMIDTIEHVENPSALFDHLVSLLAPGGRLIVVQGLRTTPSPLTPSPARGNRAGGGTSIDSRRRSSASRR